MSDCGYVYVDMHALVDLLIKPCTLDGCQVQSVKSCMLEYNLHTHFTRSRKLDTRL